MRHKWHVRKSYLTTVPKSRLYYEKLLIDVTQEFLIDSIISKYQYIQYDKNNRLILIQAETSENYCVA
jgi:hypothetical protein